MPRLDGRNMVMVLAPDKRARQSAAARVSKDNGREAATPEAVLTESAPTEVAKTINASPAASTNGGGAAGAEGVPAGGTAVPIEEGT